jgi:hypothetical protein
MRREIGYLLAGLGTFLIVLAVVLPVFIDPNVIKWPVNQYLATVLRADNASYYSSQKLQEVTGATVEAHYTFKSSTKSPGTSSTAVWDEYNVVQDVTNNFTIQYGFRTFAFDRKSAELVNCCGASVDNKNIPQTGIAGYAFPIGTQKKTYMVFDAATGTAQPFTYSGTATVRGIQAYMFDENVASAAAIDQPVPANYANHVVYDIDPVTGIPLDITEHETLTGQSGGVTLFDANLAMTPSTVTTLVNTDNSNRLRISLLRTILPVAMGILGAVLLIVGALLSRRRGRHEVVESAPAQHASGDPIASQETAAQGLDGSPSANGTGLDGTAPEDTTELPQADSEAQPGQD